MQGSLQDTNTVNARILSIANHAWTPQGLADPRAYIPTNIHIPQLLVQQALVTDVEL